ncbi:MAG: DUF1080 domain-containing protein, partial [Saprospiraceae bacterium]|nr:DUF1080 domain-containing protein [Saprospiraceae bacterium]
PDGVFSVVEQENENVMRISGQHFGGISTVAEFENYHLQLEFKWGGQKWPPRDNAKRDSGLLYHSVGPHGADYGYWMRSQELQIQEGDCGDYWGVAGAIFDIRAVMDADSNYYFDPKGELMTFSDKSNVGRHCIKSQDAERPSGEWNTIDLYSLGGTAIHVVNGVKNMILQSSRHQVDNTKMPLTRGKIQIQSEGAEVYYRNIRIRSISKLPESFTKS